MKRRLLFFPRCEFQFSKSFSFTLKRLSFLSTVAKFIFKNCFLSPEMTCFSFHSYEFQFSKLFPFTRQRLAFFSTVTNFSFQNCFLSPENALLFFPRCEFQFLKSFFIIRNRLLFFLYYDFQYVVNSIFRSKISFFF